MENNKGMGIMPVLILVGLAMGWVFIVPMAMDAVRTVSRVYESSPELFWLGTIVLLVGLVFYKKNKK